jgi:hypothetical protein
MLHPKVVSGSADIHSDRMVTFVVGSTITIDEFADDPASTERTMGGEYVGMLVGVNVGSGVEMHTHS